MIPGTRSRSPRVVTTRRSRGFPGRSYQRTYPPWWAPLFPERGGDRCGLAQLQGACVAGGRVGHQVGSLGDASHTSAASNGGTTEMSGSIACFRPAIDTRVAQRQPVFCRLTLTICIHCSGSRPFCRRSFWSSFSAHTQCCLAMTILSSAAEKTGF